jgi:hypothetical protein
VRVKLSERQAAIILGAKWHIVNGVTTRRVHHIKGTPSATYEKLWRLGLIVAPHEYADLTRIGAEAENLLKHNDKAKVWATDMPGGKVMVYDAQPVEVTPEAMGAALTAAEQMLDRLAQQAGPRP